MTELKTIEDLEYKAEWLLRMLMDSRIKATLQGMKLTFTYSKHDVRWLAAELFDIYNEGINHRGDHEHR